MKKVLLVEDGHEIQILVKGAIGKWVQLTLAPTVAQALDQIKTQDFDLFILDVMLPDGQGYEVCKQLRATAQHQHSPVIFLTTKAAISDKLIAFELGADDYVVKPFEPLELKARVEARLRLLDQAKLIKEWTSFGKLKLSVPYQKAFTTLEGKDQDLNLSPNEFRLLYFFVQHTGQVLSRDQILATIWGKSVSVGDRTVDTHVSTLRRKIGSELGTLESVFGKGYRFTPR